MFVVALQSVSAFLIKGDAADWQLLLLLLGFVKVFNGVFVLSGVATAL